MAVLESTVNRNDRSAAARTRAGLARLRDRMMVPVDASGLAVFRVGFGLIIAWEAWRFFERGYIRSNFLVPDYLFTWWGFDWVRPHEVGSYVHIGVLGVAAVALALGAFSRLSAIAVFLGIAYVFLLDKATYLNHVYLAGLIAFLLIVVPAHATWSLDARRKPWVRSETVPTWSLWLMRAQVGIPYFFAGAAKLNFDWLARSEPLREWLIPQTDFPLIGRLFDDELVIRTMTYGSAFLDLSVAFFLLNRRTRAPAYGLALAFHLFNSRVFSIGIFPWMMIVVTTVFFDADWPRRMLRTIRSGASFARIAIAAGAVVGLLLGATIPRDFAVVKALVAGFGFAVLAFHLLPAALRAAAPSTVEAPPWRRYGYTRRIAWFVVGWLAVQILLPLRHFAIPGNVNWTEEGYRFSWHMMLRQKDGFISFNVRDPATGETWTEDLRKHITPAQERRMHIMPDMILDMAHRIEDFYREAGIADVEVRVEAEAWLNSREPQTLIDPTRDLTTLRGPLLWHADWIVPLRPFR